MHVSFCRICGMPQQPELAAQWDEVMRHVRVLSEGMRGMRATLRTVWHVEEQMQMTCGDVAMGCIVTDLALALAPTS